MRGDGQRAKAIPVVLFNTSGTMRVDGRVTHSCWLVEAESVVAAVAGTTQLLHEIDDGIMYQTQHPQPVCS